MKIDRKAAIAIAADNPDRFDGSVITLDLGDLGKQAFQATQADIDAYIDGKVRDYASELERLASEEEEAQSALKSSQAGIEKLKERKKAIDKLVKNKSGKSGNGNCKQRGKSDD